MRIMLSLLTAGTATLLLIGCTAGKPAAARQHSAAGGAVTVSPTATSTTVAPTSEATPSPTNSSTPTRSTPAPTTASASSSAPPPHTRQVVLRPVKRTGRVAPGYTLSIEPDGQLLCGGAYATESPVAVDDGIEGCSPSAEYAVACWAGPTPNTARCFRDPWKHQVVQLATQGPLSSVRAPKDPSPLGLELSDGARCSIRDGGAWGELVGHPDLFGTYGCSNGEDVWAPRASYGVNRTHALWTVRVASDAGRGPLHTVGVLTAYFVGTSHSG